MERTMEKPKYSGYGYHGGGRKKGSGEGTKRVSFSVSCQPEELERLKALAKERAMPLSNLIVTTLLGT